MRFRSGSLGILVVIAVLGASCSGSSDYEATEVDVTADVQDAPDWVLEGLRIARATLTATDQEVTSAGTEGSTGSDFTLPRDETIAGLTSIGLTDEQAECVYDGISTDDSLSDDLGALITGESDLSAELLLGPVGAVDGEDEKDDTKTSELDQQGATALLLAIAPCVDVELLLSLVGAMGGNVGVNPDGTVDLSTIDPDSVDASALGLPPGVDVAALLAAAQRGGGALGPGDAGAVSAALASVATPQQVAAIEAALSNPAGGALAISPQLLAGLDLANLDLTAISSDQLGLLLAAIINGLTPSQQNQLAQIANSDFEDLGLQIDPDKLTPEDVGGLLLLLSPILTASISPTGGTPPPGVDPNEIYIPEGVTLANINPLSFVPREDVVAAFVADGVSAKFGGCFYDRLRNLSTDALAGVFTKNGSGDVAGAELILVVVQCVIAP